MRLTSIVAGVLPLVSLAAAQSVAGISNLVARRLPNHVKEFAFEIVTPAQIGVTSNNSHDSYLVSSLANGTLQVQGTTLSALSMGLRRYINEELHLDFYWDQNAGPGSRFIMAQYPLPRFSGSLAGSAVVPWRYHFNTVTFSYTAAWWDWDEWQIQLDWMALHGINLPLAWVGYEYFLVQAFEEIGLTQDEIFSFLAGPPFQSWNRFGNLAGSWGGQLPMSWITQQYALQKQIIQRMVELGMTPVLPGFAGFVPRAITRVAPNAAVVNGSNWEGFPVTLTNTTFLEPTDPLFYTLQAKIVQKQQAAYGNVSHIYTIDSFNENTPQSADPSYLASVSNNTVASLKAADPQAVWMLQGWLFYSSSSFWTNTAIEAFIGRVPNQDIIILDLFSESQPQWQRTNAYYGKPFIWCQLHDYGGNQGLYGQIQNVTVNSMAALGNATANIIGFGLTMEGQEGNEIMYDLLLDQAWTPYPIDTQSYFFNWVTMRYSTGPMSIANIPSGLHTAWEMMRTTVYNNVNLVSSAVPKAIFELSPNLTGLVNRTGHHPTQLNYDPAIVITAWQYFFNASLVFPLVTSNPAFAYDFVDLTRQVIANGFIGAYLDFTAAYASTASMTNQTEIVSLINDAGYPLIGLLTDLDLILSTNPSFLLSTWIDSALEWTNTTAIFPTETQLISLQIANNSFPVPNYTTDNSTGVPIAAYYEYTARNQLTLWGPSGQISDYASKSWAGLVQSYYLPRWQQFISYCATTPYHAYNVTQLNAALTEFELTWQTQAWGTSSGQGSGTTGQLTEVIGSVVSNYTGTGIFGY